MAKPDAVQYDKDGNEMAHWRFNQTPLKQEPVAFRNTETGEFCTGGFLRKDLAKWQPLYAAPVHASDMFEKHVHESDKDRHEKGTSQENRHIATRKTTRDEKIVNPGVYEVPEFECPRCGHCCPEHEWVGLTDEEIEDIYERWVGLTDAEIEGIYEQEGRADVVLLTQAKLKEKNT